MLPFVPLLANESGQRLRNLAGNLADVFQRGNRSAVLSTLLHEIAIDKFIDCLRFHAQHNFLVLCKIHRGQRAKNSALIDSNNGLHCALVGPILLAYGS
jgi:hypothetical protein